MHGLNISAACFSNMYSLKESSVKKSKREGARMMKCFISPAYEQALVECSNLATIVLQRVSKSRGLVFGCS